MCLYEKVRDNHGVRNDVLRTKHPKGVVCSESKKAFVERRRGGMARLLLYLGPGGMLVPPL